MFSKVCTVARAVICLVIASALASASESSDEMSQEAHEEFAEGSLFLRIDGIHFATVDHEETNAVTIGECALLCHQKSSCVSAAFRPLNRKCLLNEKDVQTPDGFSTGDVFEYDKSSIYITIPNRSRWRMVFRAQTYLNRSIYSAWNDPTLHNEETPVTFKSFGCLSVERRYNCHDYFRSNFMKQWTAFSYAKFAMYSGGDMMAYVIFSAKGASTWEEVFAMDRIVETSLPGLLYTDGVHNPASIQGEDNCGRRFLLSKTIGSCSECTGWFFVSDIPGKSCCKFDKLPGPPQFHYSKTGEVAYFDSRGMRLADVFSVFVTDDEILGLP